jgi:hypothetical protein
MGMHKRTRLTPLDRQEIWWLYQSRCWKATCLAGRFRVLRPTIYDVLMMCQQITGHTVKPV